MPLYMSRPLDVSIVEAEVLGAGAQAHPTEGRPGRPGDYLITDHAQGKTYVLTPEEFTQRFQPMAIPSHMLAPQAGVVEAPQAERDPRYAEGPSGSVYPREDIMTPPNEPGQVGDRAPLEQPMNEDLPGRPAPTPEVRPRLDASGPVETPTGLPEQPGDADKKFHDHGGSGHENMQQGTFMDTAGAEPEPEHPVGWTPNPPEKPANP